MCEWDLTSRPVQQESSLASRRHQSYGGAPSVVTAEPTPRLPVHFGPPTVPDRRPSLADQTYVVVLHFSPTCRESNSVVGSQNSQPKPALRRQEVELVVNLNHGNVEIVDRR